MIQRRPFLKPVYYRAYSVTNNTWQFSFSAQEMVRSTVTRFIEAMLNDLNEGDFDNPDYTNIIEDPDRIRM